MDKMSVFFLVVITAMVACAFRDAVGFTIDLSAIWATVASMAVLVPFIAIAVYRNYKRGW